VFRVDFVVERCKVAFRAAGDLNEVGHVSIRTRGRSRARREFLLS
jgi:sorbitol-specific phosphotransferase system component IIA